MKYKLFSSCIPVKGFARSIIADLSKGNFIFIPNALYDILSSQPIIDTDYYHSIYEHEDRETFDEYIAYLLQHDQIFTNSLIDCFPAIDLSWDTPFKIHSAIIDLSLYTRDLFKMFIEQFNQCGVREIEIRCTNALSKTEVHEMFKTFADSSIGTINLYLDNSHFQYTVQELELLAKIENRLSLIVLHNTDQPSKAVTLQETATHIIYIPGQINNKSCGKIYPGYFSLNMPTFSESQHHNTCLNRKISIDADGNIKNCPSMPENFGNVKDTTLAEAIEKPGFKKYWNITKDQIAICKDCEFRHICTDCRAYIENPEDVYSKPLKCGYNPYVCEWEEWSTNPLKQKAITYYGL